MSCFYEKIESKIRFKKKSNPLELLFSFLSMKTTLHFPEHCLDLLPKQFARLDQRVLMPEHTPH